MQRSSVDLPEPEAPMMHTTRPGVSQGRSFQNVEDAEGLLQLFNFNNGIVFHALTSVGAGNAPVRYAARRVPCRQSRPPSSGRWP